MRRVVVTGGTGRLGRLAIGELLDHGWEVLATDRLRPDSLPCRFVLADLCDAASVVDLLRGADAVLHLGAIPGPGGQPSSAIFENNVTSTYHVVETAAALGIPRLVFASTVFALGWVEEAERYWPQYVPVDEAHPQTPFEGYGLSKQVGEAICAAACRRAGISVVSLRIMNVIHPEGYGALPWPAPTRERPVRFVMWPYVDARDVARACRLALEADVSGHEPVYLAARDTRFDAPTAHLLSELAPAGLEIPTPLEGNAGVIDIRRARELLGWEPEHGWTGPK
jgi:nucleoside-diphosphate-sugar epimerase